MTSKANVMFNVLLVFVTIVLGNVLKLRFRPIKNEITKSLRYPRDSLLNFTELRELYGYSSEEHNVLTEDGYILTIFRINGRNCAHKLKRTPVLLMHGFLQSSDVWLDAGPKAGLAYLISDACYDLWVGNERGNYYSRRHNRLDPDKDPKFWKFSVDEIGFYDIPATMEYILKYTKEDKLNYIGYSQGASTFFVMCSERPGYCAKANIFIGLAPAARLTNTKSVPFKILLEGLGHLEEGLATIGIYELFAKGSLSQEFLSFLCKFSATSELLCGTGMSLFDSFHRGSITNETLRVLFDHFPAGTSVHNIARYGQSIRSSYFQKFDYGSAQNLNIYGTKQPPHYNLSAVTVPSVVLYGNNDNLVDTKDILWLIKRLPNMLENKRVSDPLSNHFDNAYSQFTKDLIFPTINKYLLKYSRKLNKV
ncbi:gastric triacylglycerol lipase-like [Vanessa atalanta]|uniref:gastric triacylglycerol lipase-like n=1 Tax=Vanessa atalanta TaxID=42275 RepID=UPI001FCD4234|nr:gastric triacylglycerol lipase-like [Vanessa atalanta]